jgi:hypothetical protein
VASAGDVNGDGYADLAVGAWGYDIMGGFNEGKAYVYHGSASGLNLTPDWSAVGEDTTNYFGFSVASAGDVNDDGYDDLVVGAPWNNGYTGKAYIYYGSAGGLSAASDWSAIGEAEDNYFGYSVAAAGDVNGDGYADLAVGAYNFNNGVGKAYVYHGSAGGLSVTLDWSAVEDGVYNHFSDPVASAGDINGDGYADLAVGTSNANRAYVYHGSANGLSAAPDWSAEFGWSVSVASAGDVNGDGYSDLVVGDTTYFGNAYVYHGSASGLGAVPDWSAAGEAEFSYFGESVSSVGDVNGDGYDDLAIGASGYITSTGKAYVYHGSTSGLSLSSDWTANGEDIYDHFGHSVAAAGDVNGDGYADLVAGAYDYNNIGKVYVYHGSAGLADCTVNCLRVTALNLRDISSGVRGVVNIQDENGVAVGRAAVSIHWDLPGGGTLDQTKITNAFGSVIFKVAGGAGVYTLTITNVAKTDYAFDPDNSLILSKSITK